MVLRLTAVVLFSLSNLTGAQVAPQVSRIPKGAKVFVAPMLDGFDTFLKAALVKKKVPVEIVPDRAQAEYEITGVSESKEAGTAKKVLFLDWRSTEQASIKAANLKTGEVAFAYSVHKQSSNHGKQSSAEACAKHLKKEIERR
jgi:hypothetical protein